MRSIAWLFVIAVMAGFACSDKKEKDGQDANQTISDFITSFEERALPFSLEDTALNKKEPDSLRIDYKIFTGFLPDTIFHAEFGKKVQPAIYPLGRIRVKGGETYVMVKASTTKRKVAYVLAFNSLDSFVVSMPLIPGQRAASLGFNSAIDRKYTIVKTRLRRQSSGEILYTRNAYVYNSAGDFTLILTESNDVEKAQATLINPIDTFPAKRKWSGDYTQNKKNIVSVRDGRNEKEIDFFIHFEKSGGCRGELKGRARFVSENTAVYSEAGDPCNLELRFSGKTVTLKENGCGAYRDVRCFFEGSFRKK